MLLEICSVSFFSLKLFFLAKVSAATYLDPKDARAQTTNDPNNQDDHIFCISA